MAQDEHETAGELDDAPERRARVMVIDDDPLLGASLRRTLSQDFEVLVLKTGRAALDVLRTETFDLVLCDVMMPEMTGMELYEHLEAERPELAERCVFMSGGTASPAVRAFLERMGTRRFQKPVDTGWLRSLLHAMVAAAQKPVSP